jgi:CRISPR-associated protein Csm1
VLFPGDALPEQTVRQRYRKLWESFTAEAAKLKSLHSTGGDLPTYLEHLGLMMQRHTWCIPSAYYGSKPDISHFDHNRMTAALAAVLEGSTLSDKQLGELGRDAAGSSEPLALLVGGDLSGVQDFIYTITSRGAASALRGRSFYLQLLADGITRYVLDRLALPITNLVYSGGGSFYFLARPADAERLRDIQREISSVLLTHHRGELYLALAAEPVLGRDFYDGRISGVWGKLSDALQTAKLRRFSELGSNVKHLFEPQGDGGNEAKQCQVCGAEHPTTREEGRETDVEGVRKCPQCASYEALGKELRRAETLVLTQIPPQPGAKDGVPGPWDAVLAAFGWRADLLPRKATLPPNNGSRRIALALSDDLTSASYAPIDSRTAVGQRFLVNVTPVAEPDDIPRLRERGLTGEDVPEPGDILSFNALEALSSGIRRLGVLRMDVDNLGKLFAEGLEKRATLSRVAGLSSAVSLYFEGWVEVLAARRNQSDAEAGLGERLYSIYSGGDDLFFVGAWDAVVELAREVRRDLTHYAAEHPGIHASAGIALVGGKYPLSQAARDAGDAESQAKSLKWWDNGVAHEKDAVAFLGQALPWSRFGLESCDTAGVETAHALMHLLSRMGEGDDGAAAPQALVRRLIGLYGEYEEAARLRREAGIDRNRSGAEQVLWGPWMWHAAYTLTRMADRYKNQRILRDKILDLRDRLKADDFRSMEWIGLAARWAELLSRD